MSYLEALKQKAAMPIIETPMPIKKEVHVPTDEENYLNNVQDSGIADVLPELQLMCESFVRDSLFFDTPILTKHHTGHSNFIVEMMNIFEENAFISITEAVEDVSDSEGEFDPTDLYNGTSVF